MKGCILTFIIVLFFAFTNPIKAIVDPLSSPNNRFGIHITSESDLQDAANLVNSNGGEWGYITLIIRENDLDLEKWQSIFDYARELKLIPIVRIATKPEGGVWAKPGISSSSNWAEFLNNLNWVVKNRYVILFNEPNHAYEWGGRINPGEYVKVVKDFSKALRDKSKDFFILPAGFDVAALSTRGTMDSLIFWDLMYKEDPSIFSYFDGWTSHSYPNPGFNASPDKRGRLSIKSYIWETQTLRRYGLKNSLPIFITETGWRRDQLSQEKVAEYFKHSFANIWTDKKIVAITPFVLNYENPPFDQFSWKKENTSFYRQYNVVSNLPKRKGEPIQIISFKVVKSQIPQYILLGQPYNVSFNLVNTGQSIWDENIEISLRNKEELIGTHKIEKLKPYESVKLFYQVNAVLLSGTQTLTLELLRKKIPIEDKFEKEIEIIDPLPWLVRPKPKEKFLRLVF